MAFKIYFLAQFFALPTDDICGPLYILAFVLEDAREGVLMHDGGKV